MSLAIIVLGGAWLVFVGLLMAVRPAYCSCLFATLSAKLETADRRIDLVEQLLRLVVAVALIVRSPSSKMPMLLSTFGWMILISSLIILALPVRWHGAFGRWWSPKLTPATIRTLSFVPLIAGPGLVYAAL